MDGARLHTLGSISSSSAPGDDGEVETIRISKAKRREKMIGSILALKESCSPELADVKTPPGCSSPSSHPRLPATPMRRRRGPCKKCGWLPQGAPRNMALCGCEFQHMDPLRPVVSVLDLASLQQHGADSAKLTMLVQNNDAASIELRLSWLSEAGKHAWPHSMVVLVNGIQTACVQPPKTGHVRADAPIQLQAPDLHKGFTLEVSAELKSPHKACELVICVVAVEPLSLSSLQQSCLDRPHLTIEDSRKLWRQLSEAADSDAVECDTPWSQSLFCPVTHERLCKPVRGVDCKHFQCFDLEAYLETSARARFHRRWHCPVCNLRVWPEQLAVCSMTMELLEQTPLHVRSVSLPSMLLKESSRDNCNSEQVSYAAAKSDQAVFVVIDTTETDTQDKVTLRQVTTAEAQTVQSSTTVDSSSAGMCSSAKVSSNKRQKRQRPCSAQPVRNPVTNETKRVAGFASWGGRLRLAAGPKVVLDL